MNKRQIWRAINTAYLEARKKKWPVHVSAQAARVSEQSGRLISASCEWKYNRSNDEVLREAQYKAMEQAAIQTAVNAIRFIENLKGYETSIIRISAEVHPKELSQDVHKEHGGDIESEPRHGK